MTSYKVKVAFGILTVTLVVILRYTQLSMTASCNQNIKFSERKDEKPIMELHVVTTFPLISNSSRQLEGYRQYKLKMILERMEEYMTALQRTLDHPYVSNVHFLYDKLDVVKYIESHTLFNAGKLSFHKIQGGLIGKSALEFAFTHLQGKLVMLNQADVYPVDGLDLAKKDVMISKKLVYALTRHGRLETNCDMRPDPESRTCHPDRYIGSHDSYIFVPMVPLAKQELDDKLTIPIDSNGIDNIHIWYFQSILHYRVLNPCLVIKMYHLHCSGLRKSGRRRFNTKQTGGTARPTTKLF